MATLRIIGICANGEETRSKTTQPFAQHDANLAPINKSKKKKTKNNKQIQEMPKKK